MCSAYWTVHEALRTTNTLGSSTGVARHSWDTQGCRNSALLHTFDQPTLNILASPSAPRYPKSVLELYPAFPLPPPVRATVTPLSQTGRMGCAIGSAGAGHTVQHGVGTGHPYAPPPPS